MEINKLKYFDIKIKINVIKVKTWWYMPIIPSMQEVEQEDQ